MRTCRICKCEKELSEFSRDRAWLHTLCKACQATYYREWRARNQEHKREADRAYFAKNAERVREGQAAWRRSEAGKAYRIRHRSQQADIEARRRAAKRTTEVDPISREAVILRDSSRCHICGKKCRRQDIQLDHLVPLSRGGSHTMDNVAVAHELCNNKRNAGYLPAQLLLVGEVV